MLKLKDVSKVFLKKTVDEVTALDHIDLTVKEGDFVTIIGSNGAGKSTLLRIINGFCYPDSGQVELMGKDITHSPAHRRARLMGSIEQDPGASVCSSMSIEDNLAMASLRGRPRGLRVAVTGSKRKAFRVLLRDVGLGLEERLSTAVGALSGGQRQALALIMAAMTRPKVLLLDEHIAALDPKTAQQVMEITRNLVVKDHLTTLMITHNMAEAIRWGDRLIMMNEGRIIMDIYGEEKRALTVADLTRKFHEVCDRELAVDRMLLSS